MQDIMTYRVGDATISKIFEIGLDAVDGEFLFPGIDPGSIARERGGFGPGSVDPRTGSLRLSIHSWLVRTPSRVILVDTATGNDKERPGAAVLHRLNAPFLERLRAAGVTPEDVDLVLLTHLHADHVGWNTHLANDHWVPAFPNAQHVFSGREHAYLVALSAGDGSDAAIRDDARLGPMLHPPLSGVYEDSVRPIVEAGLARQIVVDGSEVVEGFRFLPSPGHSIDHACVSFTSRGERALFWGDVMHHPLQVARPDWNSVYCEFPAAALTSRRWAMEHAAETRSLVFTTHFAESSAGRISRDGDRFAWQFV
ncbi:MBL fold metallo-hydrolase [Bradyrhizobium sp. SSBR45G]|uniref:MBL fold metallo-hydrolase n=1 Tax=unclassified Bradyrhizobium TaxID=2631580 RepID=UPI002342A2AA|nr:MULTISPECIES: MBL fold metallo-hydrolase [unclassified Bradyrhizobium]GLH75932.1 MBL fold metallo-hydrolase [Bradyrhizobium sp. SSBR45G]GLH85169.1 MBL fold metallo-hydrolase [Bradyrhizobium sp. SSBR45R]